MTIALILPGDFLITFVRDAERSVSVNNTFFAAFAWRRTACLGRGAHFGYTLARSSYIARAAPTLFLMLSGVRPVAAEPGNRMVVTPSAMQYSG